MYAIVADGPESLTWQQVPDVTAGLGEVLVEVAAAGVNRADLLQRQGLYPGPSVLDADGNAYEVPGMEFSGTVARTR